MRKLSASSAPSKPTLNSAKLQTSTDVLRALAHPLRLKIIQYIDANRTVNVNRIYNTLKLEQSITSQHLRILRLAGLVTTTRDGKYIHYAVDYDKVAETRRAVGVFLSFCPVELDDDDEEIL